MVGLPGIQGEATESSQMGVFNVNFLTGTPSTRADKDAEAALRLIGHELFHTWSGESEGGVGLFCPALLCFALLSRPGPQRAGSVGGRGGGAGARF